MKKVTIMVILSIIICSTFNQYKSTSYGATFDDVWLVSSLNILDSGPYLQGQTIKAEFKLKNMGLRTIYLDGLTISGLIGSDKNTNFTWYRNIPIKPDDFYNYTGLITLNDYGKYNFSIKYKTYGDKWEKSIKSLSGIKSKNTIEVKKNSKKQKSKYGELNSINDTNIKNRLKNGDSVVPKDEIKDVKGHWAKEFINELSLQGVVEGFPDGKFYPDRYITKAEFTALLCKGLYLKKEKTGNSVLSTIKNTWSYNFINSTYNLFNKKNLNVNEFESREELVSALVNALKWENKADIKILKDTFMDSQTISEVNKMNVAVALKKGLINGYNDKTFKGDSAVTRAEACKLMHNAQIIGGNSIIYEDYLNVTGNDKTVKAENIAIKKDSDKKTNTNSNLDETDISENLDANIYNKDSKKGVDFLENSTSISNENPNNKTSLRTDRLEYIFGYNQYGQIDMYNTEQKAKENVTEIEIKVWDFDKTKVNKITKSMKITVNKKIADVVKIIFANIYNNPEKFPIKCIASYAWRVPMSSGRLSEHNYGTCIDINPSENPYIINGKNITDGKWQPGINPYSISIDSSVMKVFREYKWAWGGSDWSESSHDYMHFSYLGH